MNRPLFFLTATELLLLTALGPGWSGQPDHPAVKILAVYEKLPPDGEVSISPYIVDLYSIDLVSKKQMLGDVKRYIEWHFKNLNYPDKSGMTGTICDFELDAKGDEKKLATYDSADSYAATFLVLLRDYQRVSGDTETIKKNQNKILDIAYTMAHLQDSDGLTWALSGHDEKYLMDNCEVIGGLQAIIELSRKFGWRKEDYYETVMKGVAKGITTLLWDEKAQNFGWALDRDGVQHSIWSKLYPDALSQLFPVIWDIPGVTAATKKHLLDKFSEHQSKTIANAPPEQRLLYEIAKKRAINK